MFVRKIMSESINNNSHSTRQERSDMCAVCVDIYKLNIKVSLISTCPYGNIQRKDRWRKFKAGNPQLYHAFKCLSPLRNNIGFERSCCGTQRPPWPKPGCAVASQPYQMHLWDEQCLISYHILQGKHQSMLYTIHVLYCFCL